MLFIGPRNHVEEEVFNIIHVEGSFLKQPIWMQEGRVGARCEDGAVEPVNSAIMPYGVPRGRKLEIRKAFARTIFNCTVTKRFAYQLSSLFPHPLFSEVAFPLPHLRTLSHSNAS